MAKKTAKSAGIVRKSLSIPVELETRLEEAAQAGFNLNLSRLATAAIEDELNRLKRLEVRGDLEFVVVRLKSLLRMPALDAPTGYLYGRRWAALDATPAELLKLESLMAGNGWAEFVAKYTQQPPLHDRLFYEIMDERRNQYGGSSIFWINNAPDEVAMVHGIHRLDLLPDEFIEGFTRGALSLWAEVKDHVQPSINVKRRTYEKRSREPK